MIPRQLNCGLTDFGVFYFRLFNFRLINFLKIIKDNIYFLTLLISVLIFLLKLFD
jgi:hypothetical protein